MSEDWIDDLLGDGEGPVAPPEDFRQRLWRELAARWAGPRPRAPMGSDGGVGSAPTAEPRWVVYAPTPVPRRRPWVRVALAAAAVVAAVVVVSVVRDRSEEDVNARAATVAEACEKFRQAVLLGGRVAPVEVPATPATPLASVAGVERYATQLATALDGLRSDLSATNAPPATVEAALRRVDRADGYVASMSAHAAANDVLGAIDVISHGLTTELAALGDTLSPLGGVACRADRR
jgi:hypothetical protein